MCKMIDTRGLGLDDFLADNAGGWADIPDLRPLRSKAKKTKSKPRPSSQAVSQPTVCQVGRPANVVKL